MVEQSLNYKPNVNTLEELVELPISPKPDEPNMISMDTVYPNGVPKQPKWWQFAKIALHYARLVELHLELTRTYQKAMDDHHKFHFNGDAVYVLETGQLAVLVNGRWDLNMIEELEAGVGLTPVDTSISWSCPDPHCGH